MDWRLTISFRGDGVACAAGERREVTAGSSGSTGEGRAECMASICRREMRREVRFLRRVCRRRRLRRGCSIFFDLQASRLTPTNSNRCDDERLHGAVSNGAAANMKLICDENVKSKRHFTAPKPLLGKYLLTLFAHLANTKRISLPTRLQSRTIPHELTIFSCFLRFPHNIITASSQSPASTIIFYRHV